MHSYILAYLHTCKYLFNRPGQGWQMVNNAVITNGYDTSVDIASEILHPTYCIQDIASKILPLSYYIQDLAHKILHPPHLIQDFVVVIVNLRSGIRDIASKILHPRYSINLFSWVSETDWYSWETLIPSLYLFPFAS